MKKGKVFGKVQITLALMLVALGVAVWLNMRFSSSKYLGEATYVDKTESSAAVETAAKASETDYFAQAQKDRQTAREEEQDLIKDTLKSDSLTDQDKADAVAKTKQLADRMEKENNMETLLKAKGFEKAVAVIGDNNVNVIVKTDGLTTAQTLQIQDIVVGETDIPLGNIKIVTVK